MKIPVTLRIQVNTGRKLEFATSVLSFDQDGISNIGVNTQTCFADLELKIDKLLSTDGKIGDDKWSHQTFIYHKSLEQVSLNIINIEHINLY